VSLDDDDVPDGTVEPEVVSVDETVTCVSSGVSLDDADVPDGTVEPDVVSVDATVTCV
jgi:hypothetical protein